MLSLGSRLTLLLDLEDGQAPMRLTDVLLAFPFLLLVMGITLSILA